jgi:hypothetical protein
MIISTARISKTWTSKFKNLNKLTLKNWVKIIKKCMNKIEVFPQIGIIIIDIHRIRIIVWAKEILLFQNLTEVVHKINKLILRMKFKVLIKFYKKVILIFDPLKILFKNHLKYISISILI